MILNDLRRVAAVLACFALCFSSMPVHAATFSDTIRGKILLDVEAHGEAWYVYPDTSKRVYLGRKEDAYNIMRSLGLGITNADLEKIPVAMSPVAGEDTDNDGLADTLEIGLGTDVLQADSDGDGYTDAIEIHNNFNPLGTGARSIDYALLRRLTGKILLQVEGHGEAWYVYPGDLRRYYLGTADDAYSIMRQLGLGITTKDLARISIDATSLATPPSSASSSDGVLLEKKKVSLNGQTFSVTVLTLDRTKVDMFTRTASVADCFADCPAKSVETYVKESGALAGVNGSYFCPPDYADCLTRVNSYDPPFFDSGLGVMMNEEKIKYHNRPMVAEGEDGILRYFHRPDAFGDSVSAFVQTYHTSLSAGFGSWPSLVENGVNVYGEEPSEAGFLKKGRRGAFGWTDDAFFVVITDAATMAESAAIVQSLGVTYAINIDGGASSALYVDGTYAVNGGRLVPNAILFKTK